MLRDDTVVDLPRQKLRQGFATDREWDAYSRQKASDWIRGHPDQWRAYRVEKIERFFLSIEKTPYSIAAVYAPPQGLMQRAYDGAVSVWLIWGRVVQAAFTLLVVAALIRGPGTHRFLAIGLVQTTLAHVSRYLAGFNYERHISPYLLLLALGGVFLWQTGWLRRQEER